MKKITIAFEIIFKMTIKLVILDEVLLNASDYNICDIGKSTHRYHLKMEETPGHRDVAQMLI